MFNLVKLLINFVSIVNPSTKHTVGVEFGMKYEKVNNKTIKV